MNNFYRINILILFAFFFSTIVSAVPVNTREGRSAREFASNSVLAAGNWYRLAVAETGIHRITHGDFIEMGIDPSGIDPAHIRIYGNGSGMLDEAVATPRPDDLMENAIFVSGQEDGRFDPEDYILFYGEGPVAIKYNPFYLKYEHELNFYTDRTYYFLSTDLGPGLRISQAAAVTEDPTHEVYHSEELVYHEKESVNLIKSGKLWFGEVFKDQLTHEIEFNLQDIDTEQPVTLKANLAGKSTTNTVFNIFIDGEFLEELDVPSTVLGSSIYARPVVSNYETFYAEQPGVIVRIEFEKPSVNDLGWLNYIELNYMRHLIFNGGQFLFRNMQIAGPGNIARYHITKGASMVAVWDVTMPEQIVSVPFERVEESAVFTAAADQFREYIIYDGSGYLSPEFIEAVENQDLHSLQPVDYLVISHPLFMEQAYRLADHHRQHDGMTAHVVTPQQIYNEFSSGAQDVSAIRDFMKMLYERGADGRKQRYLLLFGDASYDYMGRIQPDHNYVPAYQARESLKAASSFVTDDFFGILDDDEGNNASGTVDIGIGRFPVHTVEQAEDMVNKVIRYATQTLPNSGNWRNGIALVADDEDNNIHFTQAQGLDAITDSLGPVYNVRKVYLDAYEQMQTPGGTRYPEAYSSITRAVEEGSLIINYTGHGGETGWAAERVLDIPAIQAFRNIDHMPIFVTATCEFSRYDDPSLVSAGELVFLNPQGGGIGLFTTTRLAYSQSNYALNKRFYEAVFMMDSLTGEYPRMGDLIRLAKTPSNVNIKNFVLLGDPGLMPAYPKMQVRTLEILNENSGRPADTLHALSTVTITGQVEDLSGNRLEYFNGYLNPTVYDKPVLYHTRGNDPQSKVAGFYIQDKVLYEGRVTVEAGLFSFTFIVPKDISYQIGEGKISYYAVDTNIFLDAHGYDRVLIGGNDSLSIADTQGPDINLYLNTFSFESGDITTPDPMLIVRLFDESGINTVGNGIGHDIVAIIDNNHQMPVILNDYFVPNTDSFQGGEIQYRIGPFSNGQHELTLKAWDVFNNSSEATIQFVVNDGARLVLGDVINYPNPVKDQGTTFSFRHNRPGAAFQVSIGIFNLLGQPVTRLEYEFTSETQESVPYYWDGLDADGNELNSGLYVYHLIVKTDDGFIAETSQKLLKLR